MKYDLEPVVQVRFCEDTALSLAERTFSTEVDEQLAEDVIQYARRMHTLYTAPQPVEQGEPVAWLRFRSHRVAADDVIEGLEICEPGETGDDGGPAFPVYAAPQPAEQQPDVALLVEALEDCITWLEPYDDIKPRDWKTDRENLRRAHQSARAALAAYRKQQRTQP